MATKHGALRMANGNGKTTLASQWQKQWHNTMATKNGLLRIGN